MSYVKHTWETGEVIDAEKLNNLETGVESAGGADWNASEGEDGFIENKPFETIGSGLTVEDGALKTTGGSGGRGADWDAEEGEDGFIENKPFESHIENVPGLPHTYMDNLSVILNEDLIDKTGLSAEIWEREIGIPREKCFMSSGLILNYTQAQGCYSFTHEGAPYPGDEAIIEEYGSVQAFGEAMAVAIIDFMGLPVPCTYIGDFNYVTGNLPNITSLKNPVYSSEVYGNEESSCPVTISVNSLSPTPAEPMFTTNHVDIWGNTGIFSGYAAEILRVAFDTEFISPICAQVNNPTLDKYYFAISTISYMGMYPIYWYDIVFADDKYFGKDSEQSTVTYTAVKSTDAGSGITVSTDGEGNQVTHFELQDRSNQYLAIIYEIEASNDVTTYFDMGNYTSGKMWDAKFKFILDGEVISSFDKNQWIDEIDDYSEDLQISQGTHTVVIELSWDELDSYGMQLPQYFDLIIFNSEDGELTFTELSSAEVEVTTYTYNSSFDYTLESAEKEVIKQIESKFIEKPVWWFGDKEVVISEPTHLITNAGIYAGGM